MRTMFEMGFRNGFRPLIGQDDITGEPTVMPPDSVISPMPAQIPTTPTTPTPTPTKPAASGDDWAKAIATGITAAGAGYGAYTKEQVAKINEQTAKLKTGQQPGMPGGVPAGAGAISPNTMFLVGGLAVVGVIAAIVLK